MLNISTTCSALRPHNSKRLATALVCGFLGACATTNEPGPESAEVLLGRCEQTLQHGDAYYCLGVLSTKGFVLLRQVADEPPQISDSLPIPFTISLRMEEGLHYAFDSLWISYSGHPMGVLRIDPVSLQVQARFPIDTGWDSRWFGSMGVVVVSSGAVWGLTEGKVYRIDPVDNSLSATSPPFRVRQATGGEGFLWVVTSDRILKLADDTMVTLATFIAPTGTKIYGKVDWGTPEPPSAFIRDDGSSIVVTLTVVNPELLECYPECPKSVTGHLDAGSASIVVSNH